MSSVSDVSSLAPTIRGGLPQPGEDAPFYLIYRTGFGATNGTSIYLAKLFDGAPRPFVHVMWDAVEGGMDSSGTTLVADDLASWGFLPFRRPAHLVAGLCRHLGFRWWDGARLNRPRMQRALGRLPVRPKAAWIVCMMESDAEKIIPLWETLGEPPFVLHVMDIFHDGISEVATPRFVDLIRRASHVICISEEIAHEVRRWGARSVSLVLCASSFSTARRRPGFARPLRVVLSGALWNICYERNAAVEHLAAAWPLIKERWSDAELHYTGSSGGDFPAALRRDLHDHGLLGTEDYEQLLNTCDLAYLPVSHPGDSFARFSLPSRLADYLACGLPILAATEPGTAVHSFLQSLPDGCATNVRSAEEVVSAINGFITAPERWKKASLAAAAFARENLAVDAVRSQVFDALHEHCGAEARLNP
jgi:hypothetical protein